MLQNGKSAELSVSLPGKSLNGFMCLRGLSPWKGPPEIAVTLKVSKLKKSNNYVQIPIMQRGAMLRAPRKGCQAWLYNGGQRSISSCTRRTDGLSHKPLRSSALTYGSKLQDEPDNPSAIEASAVVRRTTKIWGLFAVDGIRSAWVAYRGPKWSAHVSDTTMGATSCCGSFTTRA